MTKILASVRNVDEAQLMLEFPIGILDLKEPAVGALGALSTDTVGDIVSLVKKRHPSLPVSATVGDLPSDPELVLDRVMSLDATGVDYIKIGFFSPEHFVGIPATIKRATLRARMVAVLFADRLRDFSGPCHLLRHSGFDGVMADTADKTSGSVVRLIDAGRRQSFVDEARKNNLLCGLAGSLQCDDVRPLLTDAFDYLGFRSALCETGRDQPVSPNAVRKLVAQFV